MKKFLGLMILVIFAFCRQADVARAEVEINIGTGINNPPESPKVLVVPYKLIRRPDDKIYTPDRYHCYMRKTLKYCSTRKGKPLNGVIVNTYDDNVAYETYQNGYQSGETSVYSQSGVLLSRTYYKKGVKHGEEMIYFGNGNIKLVMRYDSGALNGRVEQYDINGALVGKMTYKKGWFRNGYCKDEPKGALMSNRFKNRKYNKIIPCGSSEGE